MKPKNYRKKHRILIRLLSIVLSASLLFVSFGALAAEKEKVVRVGWFDSSFNRMDDLGRRTGYAYEYQQKLAIYTGWKYEYIEGSWSELLQMLKDGKIDLMSDVSYTEERSKDMLYSTLPMGAEEYYLFTTPDNKDITSTDLSTISGKKVGANKGSVQIELFKDWAKANNIEYELVELTGSESNSINRLCRGDFDIYLSLDAASDEKTSIPICKIGSSDFYFAVNKSRPDILSELNSAMNHIQDDNRYYNQQLYEKYLKPDNFNSYLSNEEVQWLSKHGKIKIGYQDNYLAFCAKDKETGKLIGALNDYLKVASNSVDNAKLEFEPIAFSTAQEALQALEDGEIDCMFPVNLTDYYGESKGFSITSALMTTDMSAIVSQSQRDSFFRKERVTVAVNAGNPNYDMFLLDHFPEWRSIYFESTPVCLKAISQGKADCILMSSYRVSDIKNLCEKYNLTSLDAGVEMDYTLGVKRGNPILYSILNKVISIVPDNTMSSALSSYSLKEATGEKALAFFRERPVLTAGILVPLLALLLFLFIRNTLTLKRAKQNKELITATETDPLTGLYITNYFWEYANRLFFENPDSHMDAIVVNISRFHSVNAINGRLFGDNVLRSIGDEITLFINENGGIAGYTGSDQFSIFTPHLEDCRSLFTRLQGKLDSISAGSNIKLRMGVMQWEENTEPQQLMEHALVACNLARNYKEQLVIFDENMRRSEAFEQQLLSDLKRAAENGELTVHYQPQFNIRENPPKLIGAEALVRWNHPKYGLISSSDFIPIFERNGQISIIDNFVWRQTARQAAEWLKKYGSLFPISINLSRIDIFDSALEKTLDEMHSENGLPIGAIELEVTESAYTENSDQLIDIIERLRNKGYKVQMDDFGSGYSSLNMLADMPVDALKMDKAFITDINSNPKRVQLIELILHIAENLNIPVIAEGIETEEQLLLLQNLGCDMAQGFYFSKALPPERFEKEILQKQKEN